MMTMITVFGIFAVVVAIGLGLERLSRLPDERKKLHLEVEKLEREKRG